MSEKNKKGLGDKTSSSTLNWVDYRKKEDPKEKKKSYLDYDYFDYDDVYDRGSWYDYYGDRRKKSYDSSLRSTGSSYYSSSSSSSSWWRGTSTYTPPKRESMSSLIGSYSKSFSSRLSSDDRQKLTNIINSSIKLTREFIAILDLPFKITLNFIDTGHGCEDSTDTNMRKLYIPTKVIDYLEKGKTEEVVINTVVGMGIHEAAHMMYTCCSDVDGVKEDLPFFLLNLIEDYRVEDCLLKDRPGYQDFVDTAMEFRISLLEEGEKKAATSFTTFHQVSDLLSNTINLIRFPSNINKDIIKAHNTYFDNIRSLIDNAVLKSTMDSINLAKEISKSLIDYIKSLKLVTDIDYQINRLNSLIRDPEYYSKYFIPILYGKDKVSKDYRAKIDKVVKNSTSSKMTSSGFSTDLACCLGDMEEGEFAGTFFIKNTKGSQDLYLRIAKNVSRFVPMIKKQVMNVEKNTTINVYGCRQGLLDTTKIAEAIQEVPQVYYRTGQVKTSKVSIAVLVDESGSMWDRKESVAREAAILLNEAFGNLQGVDLYIYGHTADSTDNKYGDKSTDIRIYKEPGFNNAYALTDIQARYENRDGVAILETAKRIRKFTSTPCIMFVISDGQPSARGYRDSVGIKDTKEKVKIVEKMGFEVIQVTIDYLGTEVKEMFSKTISLEDNLDDLPKELGKVLKKTILENKVTTVVW